MFEGSGEKYGKSKKLPGDRVSPERRQFVRKESAIILARSIMLREEAKQNMFEERAVRDERVSKLFCALVCAQCCLSICVRFVADSK